ncbi:unnamed protein product [Pseudo-nitzschia multistriata]|uniref:Peptidase M11 gametolysin domain-containing protein n=1 Tax=Pseudo-nitzschia multistriata TaxID=183589 RepID=A0A448ZGC2_9STRA|nr:unnamed protein product [Pseudo-nitzschia multistriata]
MMKALSLFYLVSLSSIAASSSTTTASAATGTGMHMAKNTGTLRAIAIRVIDGNGTAPIASVEEIEEGMFEDDVCLKTQIEACSYGKLKIEPFSGITDTGVFVPNGVVEVVVDHQIEEDNSFTVLREAATAAATAMLGELKSSSTFDIFMFCMPPGTLKDGQGWQTFGIQNGKGSFYNDQYCTMTSALFARIGLNMNLAPSNAIKDGEVKLFGDKTGFMGMIDEGGIERMCYNAAKSYQLGWYSDKTDSIDPLLDGAGAVRRFILNGVTDYESGNTDALIVLRLDQSAKKAEYYLGYNRKDGINRDTTQDFDMVNVLRKEDSTTEFGPSNKIASLFPGQKYTIGQFNDDRDVEIRFVGLDNGLQDAIIEVVDVENDDVADPKPCANYTIEIKTDKYPEDTGWYIIKEKDVGVQEIVAVSPVFTEPSTTTKSIVCLPYNTNYQFVIIDRTGDGLQFGSYRGLDPEGNELFFYKLHKPFARKVEPIQVGLDPAPTDSPTQLPSLQPSRIPSQSPTVAPSLSPTRAPVPPPTPFPSAVEGEGCQDKRKRLRWKKKRKMRRCKWIASKRKCDEVYRGKKMYTHCPKACKRCDIISIAKMQMDCLEKEMRRGIQGEKDVYSLSKGL